MITTLANQKILKRNHGTLVKVFSGTCSEPSCEKLLLQLDALLAISLVVMFFHILQGSKSLIKSCNPWMSP